MPNIAPLAFIDTSLFTSILRTKYWAHFDRDKRRQEFPNSPHHDTQTIPLRGPKDPTLKNWFEDIPQVDYPLLGEWKSARNLLSRIINLAASLPTFKDKDVILGKAMIVRLKPKGYVDWHVDEGPYAEKHDRLHLCLIPSSCAVVYSGPEARILEVGRVYFFNNRVPHSAINMGDEWRTHLILDVRKPDPDE